MARLNQYTPGMTLMLFLNRLTLGMYFTIAGANKLKPTMTAGVLDKMREFAETVAGMAPLPRVLGLGYGYVLPYAEILCGLALVIGLFSRQVAWVIAAMLMSFIIGATGLVDPPKPFHANVLLLMLAMLLAVAGPGRISIDAATRSRSRS